MEVLYESCCGIDVHKSSVAVCVLLEQKAQAAEAPAPLWLHHARPA